MPSIDRSLDISFWSLSLSALSLLNSFSWSLYSWFRSLTSSRSCLYFPHISLYLSVTYFSIFLWGDFSMRWGEDWTDLTMEGEGEFDSYLLDLVLTIRSLICYRVYLLIAYINIESQRTQTNKIIIKELLINDLNLYLGTIQNMQGFKGDFQIQIFSSLSRYFFSHSWSPIHTCLMRWSKILLKMIMAF